MKAKTLLAALFLSGLVVSMALAQPGGKDRDGSGTTSTATVTRGEKGEQRTQEKQPCKPGRAAILRGEFVAPGGGGFAMAVSGGNRVGKKLAGKQVTVLVTDGTTFRRHGNKAKLSDFVAGDRLNVHGRTCRLDEAALTLVAGHVVGRPAKSEDDEDDASERVRTSPETSTAT